MKRRFRRCSRESAVARLSRNWPQCSRIQTAAATHARERRGRWLGHCFLAADFPLRRRVAGVLYQWQHPKCPTIVRTIRHEIAVPDVILILRPVLRQSCAIFNASVPEFAPSTSWLSDAQNWSFEAVRQTESVRIVSNVAVVVLVQATTGWLPSAVFQNTNGPPT